MRPTHHVTAGENAGRDCWIDHTYQSGEWAEVMLMPIDPWPFPELACVRTQHLRRIEAYERAVQLGEALL